MKLSSALAKKIIRLSLLGTSTLGLLVSSGVSFAKYYTENNFNDNAGAAKFNVTLTKPIGARYMSESTTTVSVKLGSEVTKEIDGISIETKNLGNDYVASTVNVEDTTSTIIAKGVQSVLDSITPESLNAYVDLSGKGPGTYSVPVEVVGDNLNATYTPKTKTIQIKIANKS